MIGEDKPLAVVRTVQPYDKAALLETLVPGAKKQEIEGKTCYKSADKDRLVCFVDERVFFIGDKADETAFAHYLKGATTKPDFSSKLTQALSETSQHLAIGCVDVRLLGTLGENSPFDKPGSAQLVGDTEWAIAKCDYDGELKVDVRFTFPERGKRLAGYENGPPGRGRFLRMLCLNLAVASDLVQGDDAKDLRRFKSFLPLARQLEKSLQDVEAKPVKCDGGYELAVKFGVKASKEALTKALADVLDEKSLGIGTTVSGSSLPPPQNVFPNPGPGAVVGGVLGAMPSSPATRPKRRPHCRPLLPRTRPRPTAKYYRCPRSRWTTRLRTSALCRRTLRRF